MNKRLLTAVRAPFFRRAEIDPSTVNTPEGRKAFLERDTSLDRARLQVVRAELCCLYEEKAASGQPPIAVLVDDDGEPYLTIRGGAVVVIDSTGCYVFCEKSEPLGDMVTTLSKERLLDHIVSYLARGFNDFAPRSIDAAIAALIGQSIADVERKLVIETLWHFRGNREQTALALEMPMEILNEKLRAYLCKPQIARISQ